MLRIMNGGIQWYNLEHCRRATFGHYDRSLIADSGLSASVICDIWGVSEIGKKLFAYGNPLFVIPNI